jgi:hypothetical protein
MIYYYFDWKYIITNENSMVLGIVYTNYNTIGILLLFFKFAPIVLKSERYLLKIVKNEYYIIRQSMGFARGAQN